MKIQLRKKQGFTVIELLVVVAIIAILIGIISAAIITEINRAKIAKANTDMAQFQKFFHIARGNTGLVSWQITGEVWSAGPCISNPGDLRNIDESDPCYANWAHVVESVQAAAGDDATGLSGMLRDPWGSPYLFNENEQEQANCFEDTLTSVGPDGLVFGANDNIQVSIPLAYPCPY